MEVKAAAYPVDFFGGRSLHATEDQLTLETKLEQI
jgi:hypothetical protein